MGGYLDLKLKLKTQFPSPSSQLWLVAIPLASANISITAESCIGCTGLNQEKLQAWNCTWTWTYEFTTQEIPEYRSASMPHRWHEIFNFWASELILAEFICYYYYYFGWIYFNHTITLQAYVSFNFLEAIKTTLRHSYLISEPNLTQPSQSSYTNDLRKGITSSKVTNGDVCYGHQLNTDTLQLKNLNLIQKTFPPEEIILR